MVGDAAGTPGLSGISQDERASGAWREIDRAQSKAHKNRDNRAKSSACRPAARSRERVWMEQLIPWSETFAVGHPALDHEHHRIVETINKIHANSRTLGGDDLTALLLSLREAAASHFEHEDRILRAIAARTSSARPGQSFLGAMSQALIAEHIGQHAHSLTLLDATLDEARAAGQQPQELAHKCSHWFVTHAVKDDSHLKTLFQTMEKDRPDMLKELV
jgi:hemerythrin